MFRAERGPYGGARTKRLIWVDGKVIKFDFRRFVQPPTFYVHGIKWGFNENEALENFVGSSIRLRVGRTEMQAKQMKGSFRKEFFKYYNAGALKGVS